MFAVALAVGGCAARASSAPPPAAPPTYDAYGHEMVPVAPGVHVIANYDEPIFYVDGAYWRFFDGRWYRSPLHTSGWVYVPPPTPLLRIKEPQAYVHYRPAQVPHRHARPAPRVEAPKSMYHSPPRRLRPLQPPDSRPNTSLR
jgi:hypothetical protein